MKTTVNYRYDIGQWVRGKVLSNRKAQTLFMEVIEQVTTTDGNMYRCESADGRREMLKEAHNAEKGVFYDYIDGADVADDEAAPPEVVPVEYGFQQGENVQVTDEKYGMTPEDEKKLKPKERETEYVGVIVQMAHDANGRTYLVQWMRDPEERQYRGNWIRESDIKLVPRQQMAKRGRGRPRKEPVTA